MAWHQVSPRHWQRPLGENERMIKWIGDRAHPSNRENWSITTVATVAVLPRPSGSGPTSQGGTGTDSKFPSTASLRRAWIRLRFFHPGMATTASNNTLDYIVPDSSGLVQWAEETFFVVSDSTVTADDLIANHISPSPFVTGYCLPEKRQIILHTAHWRADGPGMLQLLDAFFCSLVSILDDDNARPEDPVTSLSWGDEPERLPHSIETMLEIPEDPSPEIKSTTAECLATGRLVAGSVGLPHLGDDSTKPQGTRWIRRSLSRDSSIAILTACRERHLRPLAAVHASLAESNLAGCTASNVCSSSSSITKPDLHYTSTMRFNLRPYLPSQNPLASSPSRETSKKTLPSNIPVLYTGNYMVAVPASRPWQDNAAHYEALYAAGLSREFLMARRQFAVEALSMLQQVTAGGEDHGGKKLPPPQARSEIDISSFDNVEDLISPLYTHYSNKEHGKYGPDMQVVQVEDISLGIECLAKESYLFFWVFRGILEFNLTYNEAFYNENFMEQKLDVVLAVLAAQLLGKSEETA